MNEQLLYNTAVDRLKKEDLELTKLTNNGIFYAKRTDFANQYS